MSALVSKIFPISDADIKKVRSNYGKTENDIQVDVDIIVAWLEQQVHLPKEHDRKRLERFLLRNKFRLERTKQKLDAYYCSRNMYGEFFADLDPRSSRMMRIKNITYHVPLPKLTPSMERVVIMKVGKNIKDYHNLDVMSLLMLIVDIQLSHDYADSDRIVIDMEGYTVEHFKTSNITHVSKTATLYLNCFSGRLGGVDIINPIPFLPMFMSLLKMCIPAKLMERVSKNEMKTFNGGKVVAFRHMCGFYIKLCKAT